MLILILSMALRLPSSQSVSADWLIDQHEEQLARLQSFRATVKSRGSTDGGSTGCPCQTMRVIRSGDRARVDVEIQGIYVNGTWMKRSDRSIIVSDPATRTSLGGVDPDHPPTFPVPYLVHELTGLGPDLNGRISPSLARGPQGYPGVPGPQALGFCADPMQSIREQSRNPGSAGMAQERGELGTRTWILHLASRDGLFTQDVEFDEKFHFLITAIHLQGVMEMDWKVDAFQEPAPGIFIARKTSREIRRPEWKVPLLIEDSIQISDVNGPIPASEFTLAFPPETLVIDDRDQSYNIWGNGRPATRFPTAAAFVAWLGTWHKIRMVSLLCAVIAFMLVAYTRARDRWTRAHGGESRGKPGAAMGSNP